MSFSLKPKPNYHENQPKEGQHEENLILFHMTSNSLKFDLFIKFYPSNIKFSKYGGHLGRHLGFGSFHISFFF